MGTEPARFILTCTQGVSILFRSFQLRGPFFDFLFDRYDRVVFAHEPGNSYKDSASNRAGKVKSRGYLLMKVPAA